MLSGIVIGFLLLAGPFSSHASPGLTVRAGPAQNPNDWPDFGGTPDITVPKEMGLSGTELQQNLKRLEALSQAERARATKELHRNAPGSEAVIEKGLWSSHGVRNSEMRSALQMAHRQAGHLGKKRDLLRGLLSMDPEHSELGRGTSGALKILAMLRALDSLNTLAGYKLMIAFSPRHAGVFRREIGRMLVAHDLDALPALIYGRGSKDKEIHMFSVKWIRDMGNPLLSEQVKIKNPRRLAQLLEAYASVNELNAVDVTLSLTNHDSAFVRTAARKSLETYGNNAKWPARRLYENTFAKEPPEDAEVWILLKSLYEHFDAKRLVQMTNLFHTGLDAYKEKRLKEMAGIFKDVLKADPMFQSRHEMADGFFELSDALEKSGQRDEARENLRLALRVAGSGTVVARKVKARLKWLQAEAFREAGVADKTAYELVLRNEPDHKGARKWAERLSGKQASSSRIVAKTAQVSLFVFLAILLVFVRLRSR